jgi:serine/threonine-protein phosphatase 2A regulatory subunit B'
MPPDPLPHPSSSPHHQLPGGLHRTAGVPFPTASAGPGPMSPPPGAGVSIASAGLGGMSHDPNTPPKAPAINKIKGMSGTQATPKDTIPMARTPRKQRSSRVHVDEKVELQRLPGFLGAYLRPLRTTVDMNTDDFTFPEVPIVERHELFVQKLHQCAHVFDFNDASADVGSKQIKSQTLAEMLDWITTQRGVITENIYPEVVHMASRRV